MKLALAFVTLLTGSFGIPTPQDEVDMSMFFDHSEAEARIVGGTQAAAGSHPHMVALSNGALLRSFHCGGSLIGARTVLTAAHCIDAAYRNGLSSSLRATVGTNRWNQGGQNYNFARNVTHPNYVAATLKNDLGLLITTTNVAMSNTVRVISMDWDWVAAGVPVRVAGWGRTRVGGSGATNLMELTSNVFDESRCHQEVHRVAASGNFRNVPPVEPHIEICIFRAANFGTCHGDSGSALVRTDRGLQIGVVSWGIPCAQGAPDMFARVSAFRSFITQNTV